MTLRGAQRTRGLAPPALGALGVLAAVAIAVVGARAAAGDDGFWPNPKPTPYERAMMRARNLQQRALSRGGGLFLDQAIAAYEDACLIDPNAAEPHYQAGRLLYTLWFAPQGNDDHVVVGEERRAGERIIRHWDAFERLAPLDPRLGEQIGSSLLFERALVRTKLGGDASYEAALRDYELELARIDEATAVPSMVARIMTNSAEVAMALGRIEDAVERYREGLDYSSDPLYLYGLAVALDRDGQTAKALEIMRDVASRDHFTSLVKDDVFFIPPGDVHYYRGLGSEALGQRDDAIAYFEQYLLFAKNSRYHDAAREHLARLKAEKGPRRPGQTVPGWADNPVVH